MTVAFISVLLFFLAVCFCGLIFAVFRILAVLDKRLPDDAEHDGLSGDEADGSVDEKLQLLNCRIGLLEDNDHIEDNDDIEDKDASANGADDLYQRLSALTEAAEARYLQIEESHLNLLSRCDEIEHQVSEATGERSHDFYVMLADEIAKFELNLSRMDSGIRGYKQLKRSLGRIKDNFMAAGYEFVDLLNQPYVEGMKVIATFVDDDTLEPGQRIITGVQRPQVNYRGKMIQAALVTVSQNLIPDEELAQESDESPQYESDATIDAVAAQTEGAYPDTDAAVATEHAYPDADTAPTIESLRSVADASSTSEPAMEQTSQASGAALSAEPEYPQTDVALTAEPAYPNDGVASIEPAYPESDAAWGPDLSYSETDVPQTAESSRSESDTPMSAESVHPEPDAALGPESAYPETDANQSAESLRSGYDTPLSAESECPEADAFAAESAYRETDANLEQESAETDSEVALAAESAYPTDNAGLLTEPAYPGVDPTPVAEQISPDADATLAIEHSLWASVATEAVSSETPVCLERGAAAWAEGTADHGETESSRLADTVSEEPLPETADVGAPDLNNHEPVAAVPLAEADSSPAQSEDASLGQSQTMANDQSVAPHEVLSSAKQDEEINQTDEFKPDIENGEIPPQADAEPVVPSAPDLGILFEEAVCGFAEQDACEDEHQERELLAETPDANVSFSSDPSRASSDCQDEARQTVSAEEIYASVVSGGEDRKSGDTPESDALSVWSDKIVSEIPTDETRLETDASQNLIGVDNATAAREETDSGAAETEPGIIYDRRTALSGFYSERAGDNKISSRLSETADAAGFAEPSQAETEAAAGAGADGAVAFDSACENGEASSGASDLSRHEAEKADYVGREDASPARRLPAECDDDAFERLVGDDGIDDFSALKGKNQIDSDDLLFERMLESADKEADTVQASATDDGLTPAVGPAQISRPAPQSLTGRDHETVSEPENKPDESLPDSGVASLSEPQKTETEQQSKRDISEPESSDSAPDIVVPEVSGRMSDSEAACEINVEPESQTEKEQVSEEGTSETSSDFASDDEFEKMLDAGGSTAESDAPLHPLDEDDEAFERLLDANGQNDGIEKDETTVEFGTLAEETEQEDGLLEASLTDFGRLATKDVSPHDDMSEKIENDSPDPMKQPEQQPASFESDATVSDSDDEFEKMLDTGGATAESVAPLQPLDEDDEAFERLLGANEQNEANEIDEATVGSGAMNGEAEPETETENPPLEVSLIDFRRRSPEEMPAQDDSAERIGNCSRDPAERPDFKPESQPDSSDTAPANQSAASAPSRLAEEEATSDDDEYERMLADCLKGENSAPVPEVSEVEMPQARPSTLSAPVAAHGTSKGDNAPGAAFRAKKKKKKRKKRR